VAIIGYARVSTSDQNPEAQAARLRESGCSQVFTDHGVTGKASSRPQWDACRAFLREGDALVVTKLDRIGRSVGNLVEAAGELTQRGVDLIVLDQAIDTSSPAGRVLFHVLAAIAEFERDLIAERTRDGLAAARARHGGKLPPRGPSIGPDKLAAARQLYEHGDMPARRIAEVVGISRASLYRSLPPDVRRAKP
jgi:DNA invertase Pin-like site-specific DNA recombinase